MFDQHAPPAHLGGDSGFVQAGGGCRERRRQWLAGSGKRGSQPPPVLKPPSNYLDDMLARINRWVDNPSNTNKEAVRSALDTTRSLHAWQGHAQSAHFWTLEAVDHAIRTKFAGKVADANVAAAAEAHAHIRREVEELSHARAD